MVSLEGITSETALTHSVGVILRPIEEFHARMLCGIMDELQSVSYVSMLVSGGREYGAGGSQQQILALIDRRADGLILYPTDDDVPNEYLRDVWERNIPIVTVDRELTRTRADFVGSDDEAGAAAAARHLLELDHRYIAHLAGPQDVTTARSRRLQFETVVLTAGKSCATEVASSFDDGYVPTLAVLSRSPRPTALFCVSDLMLPGVYTAASEMGLRIPNDLSVIGFSGNSLTTSLYPHATTVHQYPYEIGQRAARLVVERAASGEPPGEPEKIRLKARLVVRESTAPPSPS
jgi:LacI family transcriptional regulator